jgi:hypothetical protein
MTKHVAFLLLPAVVVFGQDRLPPRFEDFPAPTGWKGRPVALRLRNSSDVLFGRPLLEAARERANFASHYRFTMWACGSACLSGAIVDLARGEIIGPPSVQRNPPWISFSLCRSAFSGSGVDVRVNSRLMIVRCGLNYDERSHRNIPDAYYFVFEDQHFRKVAHAHGAIPRLQLDGNRTSVRAGSTREVTIGGNGAGRLSRPMMHINRASNSEHSYEVDAREVESRPE